MLPPGQRPTLVPAIGVLRKARALHAASFVNLPAGMPHYAMAEVESVVQINGVGPFDVTYVNSADDPRSK